MKLLTVGDSFTYGEELDNRSFAWPNLLAKKINYDVTNLGAPGTGNFRSVRMVVDNHQDYDMVIVAWSHFARMEFADENGIFNTWPGHRGDLFHSENIIYRMDLVKYFRTHYDDRYLYSKYLIDIVLLQNLLKSKKYLMLDAFGNTVLSLRDQFPKLTEQIDTSRFVGWPNESMMEWTYGVKTGPGGHFLEEGHKIVADKIYEHIRHFGWVS